MAEALDVERWAARRAGVNVAWSWHFNDDYNNAMSAIYDGLVWPIAVRTLHLFNYISIVFDIHACESRLITTAWPPYLFIRFRWPQLTIFFNKYQQISWFVSITSMLHYSTAHKYFVMTWLKPFTSINVAVAARAIEMLRAHHGDIGINCMKRPIINGARHYYVWFHFISRSQLIICFSLNNLSYSSIKFDFQLLMTCLSSH